MTRSVSENRRLISHVYYQIMDRSHFWQPISRSSSQETPSIFQNSPLLGPLL